MTHTDMHLELEVLSAYADGELDSAAVASAERHLSTCAECREQLRLVRELVSAAGALPREVAPPPEIWNALRHRVATGKRRPRVRRPAWSAGWLAAAAVLLVAAGWLALSPGPGRLTKVRANQPPSTPVPAVLVAVEGNYSPTLGDLRRTLETQRANLSPGTVRVVEHSLAIIDTAIAEARAALASDPANAALVEILSAQYERKVDLLQRATKLSPTT